MAGLNEIKVGCIIEGCNSVAYVREGRNGDDYFTCTRCGPYNGKGPAFRAHMAKLRADNEVKQAEPVQDEKPIQVEQVEPEGDAHRQDDWLAGLGGARAV